MPRGQVFGSDVELCLATHEESILHSVLVIPHHRRLYLYIFNQVRARSPQNSQHARTCRSAAASAHNHNSTRSPSTYSPPSALRRLLLLSSFRSLFSFLCFSFFRFFSLRLRRRRSSVLEAAEPLSLLESE